MEFIDTVIISMISFALIGCVYYSLFDGDLKGQFCNKKQDVWREVWFRDKLYYTKVRVERYWTLTYQQIYSDHENPRKRELLFESDGELLFESDSNYDNETDIIKNVFRKYGEVLDKNKAKNKEREKIITVECSEYLRKVIEYEI